MNKLKEKQFGLWMVLILLIPYFIQPIVAVAEGIDRIVKDTSTNLVDFNFTSTSDSPSLSSLKIQIGKESTEAEELFIKSSEPLKKVSALNESKKVLTQIVDNGFNLSLIGQTNSLMDFQLEPVNEKVEHWSITLPNGETKEIHKEIESEKENTLVGNINEGKEENDLSKTFNLKKKTRKLREPGNIESLIAELNNGKSLIENLTVTLAGNKPIPNEGIRPDEPLKLAVKWAIPEEVAQEMVAGDYYEFYLPEQLQVTPRSGELKGQDGIVFGNYTLTSDGKVRFDFNDEISQHGFIEGEFIHNQQLKEITKPGKVEIRLPHQESLPPIELIVKSNVDSVIEKSGRPDKTWGANYINWDIDINKSMSSLVKPEIQDILPKGLTKESIQIVPLDVDINGNVLGEKESTLTENVDYKVDGDKIIFLKDVTEAYRIKLKTKISLEKKKEENGRPEFTNKATLVFDGKIKEAEATVSADYHKNLTKTGPTEVGEGGQIYNWNVQANYLENNLAIGTKIQDRFKIPKDAGYSMSVIPDSMEVYKVTFDEDGNESIGDVLDTSFYKVVDKDSEGFDIELIKEIDYAIYISYQTKVNGYVSGAEELANDVSINGDYTVSSGGSVSNQNLSKWFTGVNYEDKTLDWQLDVNRAKYTMKNYVLTDKLSSGQTLIEDSVEIREVDGTDPVVNKDYKIEVNGQEFKIIFLGKLAEQTDKYYQIYYKTAFDLSKVDKGHQKEDDNIFWNESSHEWTDDSGKKQQADTGKIHADLQDNFKFNGSKYATYNMKEKSYDWMIDVNVNCHVLVNATIEDVIEGQHELIDDSLKIYELKVYSNSTTEKEIDVTSSIDYKIIPEGKNKRIKINLPKNSTKAYRIEYQTTHKGLLVTKGGVKNKAVFENDKIKHELSATVEPTFAGKTIEKTGEVNPENGNEVLWDATINPSQSHLENVVITDKPSSNQILDKKSIKLYSTTVSNHYHYGTIDKDKELVQGKDFDVDIKTNDITGEQVLTVKLIGELATIDTSYILRYVTTLNNTTDASQVYVSNNIKLTADHVESMETETKSHVLVTDNDATATGKAGKIRITKHSSFDDKPLEGAHFELWKTNAKREKKQLLRSGVTNKDGQWDFGNIRPGKYLLVETKAPEHFLISSELKEGKLIEVTPQANKTDIQEIKEVNDPNEVVVTKVSKDGRPLSGATFNLLDESKQLVINQTPLVSDEDGQIRLSELKEGTYYLKELSAPSGYIRNDELLPIHITSDKSDALTFTNYQGSVSFDKVDGQTTQSLKGATFDILSLDNPALSVKGITGDDNGHFKVDGLAPGKYQLVETTAPTGYLLNTDHISFTIPEHASTEPETISLGQVKNVKGSAKFKKVSEDGHALKGATFRIKTKGTQDVVIDALTGNDQGEFEIEGIAPGEYVLEETQAPTGYIRNTEETPFSIDNKGNGEISTTDIGSIVNYKGKITFDKVTETGEKLVGAKFQVVNKETKEVIIKDVESDDKGHYVVEGLAPGNYELEETQAPENYIRNKDVIAFTIPTETNGKPKEIHVSDVVNYQGDVHFKKVDETNQPLNHAEFKLSDKNTGKVIKQDIKEVAPGEFTISGLAPGEYVLEETKAPENYILNTEPYEFTIQKDESGKPVATKIDDIVNYQGSISFKKTNAQGELLGGAVFSVRDAETKHVVVDSIKETTKGEFTLTHLAPGNYELIETQAPEGYVLNTKPMTFSIDGKQKGQPKQLELDNVLNYQGSVSFSKVDDKGNALSGATFKLFNKDSGEVVNSEITEASKGQFTITDLVPGHYSLEEVTAPTGFVKNTQRIDFTIDNQSEGKPSVVTLDAFTNYQGSLLIKKTSEEGILLSNAVFELSRVIDGKHQVVATDLTTDLLGQVSIEGLAPGEYVVKEIKAPAGYKLNTQEFTVTIESSHLGMPEKSVVSVTDYQGSIQITKTDKDSNLLLGAVFAIRDVLSNQIVKNNLTTDSTGKVMTGQLMPGDYELVETKAPSGFMRNEKPLPFHVSTEDNGQPKALELTMINYKGSMLLEKVNASNELLTGAVFNLLDGVTKEVLREGLSVDEKGQLLIEELSPGRYELEETQSPTGYMINKENVAFIIYDKSFDQPEVIKETFVNYQTQAEFKKTDANGQPLKDATFDLYDKTNGTKIKENLVSNQTGKVALDNLSPGDYELVETKAPAGYILNTKKVSFKVEDGHEGKPEVMTLKDVVNYQGTVEFTKVDDTGKGLEGAIFKVVDKEGKTVQENITGDKAGKFVIDNLSPGDYELVETKAPTGYERLTTAIKFTVNPKEEGQVKSIQLENIVNKKIVPEPDTSESSTSETSTSETSTTSASETSTSETSTSETSTSETSTSETSASETSTSETSTGETSTSETSTSETSTSETSTSETSTSETSTSETSTNETSTSETTANHTSAMSESNHSNSSDTNKKSDATHLPQAGENMTKHWVLTIIGLILIISMMVVYKKRQK
ncbi:SpaA isopeptide-forming pilin-related protein [Vagococcus sp. JNUCC 83]